MRSIDELAKLPYSEMSEDEIALVVEWKAGVKAQEETFQKMQEQNAVFNGAMLDVVKATAQANAYTLNELAAQAIARLGRDEYGQA